MDACLWHKKSGNERKGIGWLQQLAGLQVELPSICILQPLHLFPLFMSLSSATAAAYSPSTLSTSPFSNLSPLPTCMPLFLNCAKMVRICKCYYWLHLVYTPNQVLAKLVFLQSQLVPLFRGQDSLFQLFIKIFHFVLTTAMKHICSKTAQPIACGWTTVNRWERILFAYAAGLLQTGFIPSMALGVLLRFPVSIHSKWHWTELKLKI